MSDTLAPNVLVSQLATKLPEVAISSLQIQDVGHAGPLRELSGLGKDDPETADKLAERNFRMSGWCSFIVDLGGISSKRVQCVVYV